MLVPQLASQLTENPNPFLFPKFGFLEMKINPIQHCRQHASVVFLPFPTRQDFLSLQKSGVLLLGKYRYISNGIFLIVSVFGLSWTVKVLMLRRKPYPSDKSVRNLARWLIVALLLVSAGCVPDAEEGQEPPILDEEELFELTDSNNYQQLHYCHTHRSNKIASQRFSHI